MKHKPLYQAPTEVPTILSPEAQWAAAIIDEAVGELLEHYGLIRSHRGLPDTMGKVIQQAMNVAHRRWLLQMGAAMAKETIQ